MKRRWMRRWGLPLLAVLLCALLAGGCTDPAGTAWALLPPAVAIILAFLTREVYASLLAGCVVGALLVSGFDLWGCFDALCGTLMAGIDRKIFFFDVLLGTIVVLFARSGASRAFGDRAARRVRSRRGAMSLTAGLGCLIFLDDYFNCLTVGTIMRPITDRFGISREKLAYLIDATAAPVCIIAPISSWAAAVASCIPEAYAGSVNGFSLFIRAIPYNFYALLTLLMVFLVALTGWDFGPMARREALRQRAEDEEAAEQSGRGSVWDLLLPTLCLIAAVVWGMLHYGRLSCREQGLPLSAANIFANTDAPMALCFGCGLTLLLMALLYIPRGVVPFRDFAQSFAEGFKLMVPALLVLTLAWGLKGFAGQLDVAGYVQGLFAGREAITALLPVGLFLVGGVLAFATGTSWGTMGILIPVAAPVFAGSALLPAAVAAVCAGAVMGDHCSPISDTTVMSAAGARCELMAHTRTQLCYGLLVSGNCVLCYLLAALWGSPWLPLLLGAAALPGELYLLARRERRRAGGLRR